MRNLEKRGLLEQALKEAGVQNDVEIEQLDVTDTTAIRSAVASTLSQTGNKLTQSFTMPGWLLSAPWRMCRIPSCGG